MGQQEIIDFLKKQQEPLTSGEIAKEIKLSPSLVSKSIRSLLKWQEISFIEIDRFESIKRCGSKRRIRLYFIEEE